MIHEAFATDPTPDLPLNVGFGSEADIRERIRDVRFGPRSRHAQRQHQCLLSAHFVTDVGQE